MMVTIRKVANGYIIEPGDRTSRVVCLDDMHVARSASECWEIAFKLLEDEGRGETVNR